MSKTFRQLKLFNIPYKYMTDLETTSKSQRQLPVESAKRTAAAVEKYLLHLGIWAG